MRATTATILCAAGLACANHALAEDAATYTTRNLTLETALKSAQVALKKCRDSGWQVAVAVVDRAGTVQVLLRDRYAGAHTPGTASGKAWTAVSFRSNTGALVDLTQPGKAQSGVRNLPQVVILGGGVIIEGGGRMLGAIGVSGAPGGEADETCAKAGIAAIQESLEF
ncbi:MAG: heme-binding protein [Burkholderiales bacterium]|nr:heme-binding protein [Burkholderiales bacterium]MCJ7838126.1 heme-binding protein [Burkholderiales bacterium]